MFSLLLAIIYLSFISLGLPDSLLGAGWPVMHLELGVPISHAGIISMIIAGGTIISSLLSDSLTKRLGAGLVTACSVALTALALFGFSQVKSFWLLCVIALPYGLGAGAVDAALNNYVALHYSSRHMSWLHAFWGVGVSISPYVMSACLAGERGWQGGYFTVSLIQCALTVALFVSLPLWKKRAEEKGEQPRATVGSLLKIRGVKQCLLAFACFCAFESTAGLWASSYLVKYRGVDEQTAASFASLFYLGITAGRFLSGFIADKLGDKTMIRCGLAVMAVGVTLIALPLEQDIFALAGLVVTGFGTAPVYPCIIHSTPSNFGKQNSQALVGIQMASAYFGSTFMPPLFGLIAENIGIGLYPLYLAVFAVGVTVALEVMNKRIALSTAD